MKMKLVASLLVLCLAFSVGSALAQTAGDNTSQTGSQMESFSTETGFSTLANKTVNISQQPGGDVRWILPGERRLDPGIFGTPQAPLGFEPGIGVPVENRSINNNGTEFTTTTEQTPFSDNYELTNGTFYMNLTDRTPVDVNQSRDAAIALFRFTDPTGKIRYRVVLRNITRVGQDHPVYGGVVIDGIAHGRTAIDTRLVPTSYVYGAFWGVGDLYVNGTLVSRNRVMHAMATESLRSADREGYKLLFDNELPHAGIETELLLPDMVMSANGTIQNEPVPTNYTLPNGQEQPFLNIMFEDSRVEGLPILDYNNTTVNLISKMAESAAEAQTGNLTTTQTGTMTGTQTGNLTENQTENLTGNQTGNMTGVQAGNMTVNQTGAEAGNLTGNMTGAQAGNMTEAQTGMTTGTQTQSLTQTESGNINQTQSGSLTQTETGGMPEAQTGNNTGSMAGSQAGNMTGSETGNMTGSMTEAQAGNMTGNQTANLTRNITGTMLVDITGNITGTTANMSNMSRNMTGTMVCNITGNITEPMTGIQTQDMARKVIGTMTCNLTGNVTGMTGNQTQNTAGNQTGSRPVPKHRA